MSTDVGVQVPSRAQICGICAAFGSPSCASALTHEGDPPRSAGHRIGMRSRRVRPRCRHFRRGSRTRLPDPAVPISRPHAVAAVRCHSDHRISIATSALVFLREKGGSDRWQPDTTTSIWGRISESLPSVATQGVTAHWLRLAVLTGEPHPLARRRAPGSNSDPRSPTHRFDLPTA